MDSQSRNRTVLIFGALVLVAIALGSILSSSNTKGERDLPLQPEGIVYYDVIDPYPAEVASRILKTCESASFSGRLEAQKFCQCKLQYIESHATVEQFEAAQREAGSAAEIGGDKVTSAASLACLERSTGSTTF